MYIIKYINYREYRTILQVIYIQRIATLITEKVKIYFFETHRLFLLFFV